jgi:NADH-ubiquinone oxidoreductase chain 1
MTEHAAVVFVFFFLAEYASIVLMCILASILFLGGYLYDYLPFSIFSIIQYINFDSYLEYVVNSKPLTSDPLIEGLVYGLSLGLKSCILIFVFI